MKTFLLNHYSLFADKMTELGRAREVKHTSFCGESTFSDKAHNFSFKQSWKKENATESVNLPETDYDLQETTTEGQESSIMPLQQQKKQTQLRLQQLHMPGKQDVQIGQPQET